MKPKKRKRRRSPATPKKPATARRTAATPKPSHRDLALALQEPSGTIPVLPPDMFANTRTVAEQRRLESDISYDLLRHAIGLPTKRSKRKLERLAQSRRNTDRFNFEKAHALYGGEMEAADTTIAHIKHGRNSMRWTKSGNAAHQKAIAEAKGESWKNMALDYATCRGKYSPDEKSDYAVCVLVARIHGCHWRTVHRRCCRQIGKKQ